MGRRGRPPKRRNITIKSEETRAVVGLILFVLSVLLGLSIFLGGQFFLWVRHNLGAICILPAFAMLGLSMKILGYSNYLTKGRTIWGIFLLWIATSVLSYTNVTQEMLINQSTDVANGGYIGLSIYAWLFGMFDKLGTIVIVMVFVLLSISLMFGIEFAKLVKSIVGIVNHLFTITSKVFSSKRKTENEPKLMSVKDNDMLSQNNTDIDNLDMTDTSSEINVKQSVGNLHSHEDHEDNEESLDIHSKNNQVDKQSDVLDAETTEESSKRVWKKPPISILTNTSDTKIEYQNEKESIRVIEEALQSFGITAKVVRVVHGPTVSQYALNISRGVKVSKIRNLSKDLALALAAPSGMVRIEAPIPGTSLVGIEVPHAKSQLVVIRELVSQLLQNENLGALPLLLGKDVRGSIIIRDLTKLPHLLIAGATGSGKSMLINAILMGLLMCMTPDDLNLILVDPKTVELSLYADIPHLISPVLSAADKVLVVLNWLVNEMQKRYKLLSQYHVRNIKEYNIKAEEKMPYIVFIVDEMADIMLTSGVDVEHKIVRLAQMARAVGIHMILATQRPSVNVLTGLIKANVPARISLSVATSVDSRVILDSTGAETLLGNGDMLFKSPERAQILRIQGAFVSNQEVEAVTQFWREQVSATYITEISDLLEGRVNTGLVGSTYLDDPMFVDAIKIIVSAQKGSASYLQRRLKIGYNRAARYIDQMEEVGVVGPADGSKPREVLIKDVDAFLDSFNS